MIRRLLTSATFAILSTIGAKSFALDKQGAAHGGAVGGPSEGFDISSSVLLGAALYNPSYAARPDNTGLAAGRLAVHGDFDLIGHRLSLPLDLNMFTDGTQSSLQVLVPTEFDIIFGATSTWPMLTGTALEFGVRYEKDLPVDRGTYTQEYIDARIRGLFSLSEASRAAKNFLGDTKLNGALTLGAFLYNPTYAARPDNTGLALLRYAAHLDWATGAGEFALNLDATMFTDRERNAVAPTELDFTVGVATRMFPVEIGVAYERDLPLDRDGLIQQFVFSYLGWSAPSLASAEP